MQRETHKAIKCMSHLPSLKCVGRRSGFIKALSECLTTKWVCFGLCVSHLRQLLTRSELCLISHGKYETNQPVEYQITDTFSVPGVGTVVSGTVVCGIVHQGDTLQLGPDSAGHFQPTIVKSIQRKRVSVPCASAGQSASFALKKIKRASIRKGMVMLSKSLEAKSFHEFEAEILVLYHSTTISPRYQAMLHCGCVRQVSTSRLNGGFRRLLIYR